MTNNLGLMVLEPLTPTFIENNVTRSCKITRCNDNQKNSEALIWFRFSKEITIPAPNDADAYLLATIMDAMKENRKVVIKGAVSRQLLSNLVEYQLVWQKWRPDLYHYVDIEVDEIRELTNQPARGAICAFSGGVDATFSVWRHINATCSYRSQNIKLCSLVHGFDIPLSDTTAFNNARLRGERTLADVSLELEPISTNYKEITNVNWEHSFACALVAVLNNFKEMAGTCIVGSSESYDALILPWGSSPVTDHLLSSGEFNIMHDGASHSRTEKVDEISKWQLGIDNLRVCWQGDIKDENCGQCEKCVRTKLNFLFSNNTIPSCFPDTNTLEDMKRVVLKNDAVRAEWVILYQQALDKKITCDELDFMPNVLNKKYFSIVDYILPFDSHRRYIVTKIYRKLRNALN
jgi:hypothetical protein